MLIFLFNREVLYVEQRIAKEASCASGTVPRKASCLLMQAERAAHVLHALQSIM